MSITDYAMRAKATTRAEFTRAYPTSVLVIASFRRDAVSTLRTVKAAALAGGLPSTADVAKREGANTHPWVSVGRARNNDICIAFKKVSKFHAFITLVSPSEARITDAGSANGTWVRGERISPNQATLLQSGDEVSLGGLRMRFLSSADLHTFFREGALFTDPIFLT